MKIKTSELSGAVLDWAVAKCEGREIESIHPGYHINVWRIDPLTGEAEFVYPYKPSTNWEQGGPIIERERIATLCPSSGEFWDARDAKRFTLPAIYYRGPTPLIAAMRCFVASKLGDEIEIPDELTN